jgi:hypothetical protein
LPRRLLEFEVIEGEELRTLLAEGDAGTAVSPPAPAEPAFATTLAALAASARQDARSPLTQLHTLWLYD